MTDDGGPDVVIETQQVTIGDEHRGTYKIKCTPDFWRKVYAGLAMQGMVAATGAEDGWPAQHATADRAFSYADAMIAHEVKSQEPT